jgi:hypothetical protein
MPTVLGPYAVTSVETCSVVRRDRSTACKFADRSIPLANLYWREDGRVFAASALDHGYRRGEDAEHNGGDPQRLFRDEIGAHQWNI